MVCGAGGSFDEGGQCWCVLTLYGEGVIADMLRLRGRQWLYRELWYIPRLVVVEPHQIIGTRWSTVDTVVIGHVEPEEKAHAENPVFGNGPNQNGGWAHNRLDPDIPGYW